MRCPSAPFEAFGSPVPPLLVAFLAVVLPQPLRLPDHSLGLGRPLALAQPLEAALEPLHHLLVEALARVASLGHIVVETLYLAE
eukprot:8130429-Pyramimonas_sp.AAC.1